MVASYRHCMLMDISRPLAESKVTSTLAGQGCGISFPNSKTALCSLDFDYNNYVCDSAARDDKISQFCQYGTKVFHLNFILSFCKYIYMI